MIGYLKGSKTVKNDVVNLFAREYVALEESSNRSLEIQLRIKIWLRWVEENAIFLTGRLLELNS